MSPIQEDDVIETRIRQGNFKRLIHNLRKQQERDARADAMEAALREIDALPVRELSAGVDSTMRPVTYMAYSAYDVQRIVRAALAQASPPGSEGGK